MKKLSLIISMLIVTRLYSLNISSGEIPQEMLKSWMDEYIGFEENLGQVSDFDGNPVENVLFKARLPGYGIFITEQGVSYVLYQIDKGMDNTIYQKIKKPESQSLHYARVDVNLIGAHIKKGMIEFEDPLPGYTNYYLPQYPDGILGVVTYRRIRIKEVYPGIDWVWKYEDGKIHHQFEIKGGDISQIKLDIKYADWKISEDGKKVVLWTPLGRIEDGDICAYEIMDKEQRIVEISYRKERHLIAFDLKDDKYNGDNYLIIDPPLSLLWATYYGGLTQDTLASIAVDVNGNVFVTGETNSTDFPTYDPGGGAYFQGTNAGWWDAFILKFNNSGVRLWATYYGGLGDDCGNSITTDTSGNVFVTGNTYSPDFPTYDPGGAYYQGTKGGEDDAFILKFNNAGVRLWATFYGAGSNDKGASITTDTSGNVFVSGRTYSTNFPTYDPGGGAYYQGTKAGGTDGFILKFSNTGQRLWATYYGGGNDDRVQSITTDTSGNVFVTGRTSSTDFPTYDPGGGAYFQGTNAGSPDAFILKFETSLGIEEDAKLPVPILLNVPTFFKNEISLRFVKSREEPLRIILYNPLGNPVFERSYSRTSSVTLRDEKIARLGSGVYFLKVYSGKMEMGKFKLIKE